MKKPVRIALRVVAWIAGLFALLALASLDFVDHTPYMRAPYYAETKARFQKAAATNTIALGELSAGFGVAKLTPTNSFPLAGYGDRRGKPSTGVHDDLFVKAAAIRVGGKTGIMFGIDALIVPREVADGAAERLRQELGLAREQLYFSATHTHCSVGGWGEGFVGEAFAGGFDPASRAWIIECIVKAARAAIDDLKPAEFAHGVFNAREFIRNRLVGDLGKVDPEFSFMLLKQTNGRIGVLGSFSAHGTVLGSSVMEYSADYPGYWQRAVEEQLGGVAIFFAGGVGSHSPVPGASGFAGAEKMGRALAKMLVEKLPAGATNRIAFGALATEVALPPFNVRVTDGIRLRPWIASRLIPAARESFLQGFRLQDNVWLSTPCDFSGEMAIEIKDMLRARGFNGVVTSFNGDYVGYVIPSRYYHLSGYEPRIMSFYGPTVPDYLDEFVRAIAMELISK